ncbi:MAG: hypothetical protein LZF60_360078 [Nitrospira sp.]|nr:MAG: hypothetical protein LZF60_360078 [Nitrospira sp.]
MARTSSPSMPRTASGSSSGHRLEYASRHSRSEEALGAGTGTSDATPVRKRFLTNSSCEKSARALGNSFLLIRGSNHGIRISQSIEGEVEKWGRPMINRDIFRRTQKSSRFAFCIGSRTARALNLIMFSLSHVSLYSSTLNLCGVLLLWAEQLPHRNMQSLANRTH